MRICCGIQDGLPMKNKLFHGMPVISYSAIKKELGDKLTVLLSFATSRPEVLDNIYKIAAENTLLAPDVPAYGNNIFNEEFYKKNIKEIEKAYDLLCDDRSKKLYEDIIKYKLTGEINYLEKTDNEHEYMRNIIYSPKIEYFVDAGA